MEGDLHPEGPGVDEVDGPATDGATGRVAIEGRRFVEVPDGDGQVQDGVDLLTVPTTASCVQASCVRTSTAGCRETLGAVSVPVAFGRAMLGGMRLSTRNQLRATVASVDLGAVMASVKVTLPDGQQITSTITREAVEDLGLAPGDDVIVLVKSTEVMIGKD